MNTQTLKPPRLSWRELLRQVEVRWWLVLLIVALTGVILMIINTYAFYQFSGDTKAPSAYKPLFNEYIIFPYYFTFISNVTAVLAPLFLLLQIPKPNSVHFQRYKVMMATNLVITLIVYWAILSRTANWNDIFSSVQTIFVHAITPVLALVVFVIDVKYSSSARSAMIDKTVGLNFIMPMAWLIFALAMYFILGANGAEDVPYGFLNVKYNAWYSTLAYIVGIALGYLLFTWIFAVTWMRAWKRIVRTLKRKLTPRKLN